MDNGYNDDNIPHLGDTLLPFRPNFENTTKSKEWTDLAWLKSPQRRKRRVHNDDILKRWETEDFEYLFEDTAHGWQAEKHHHTADFRSRLLEISPITKLDLYQTDILELSPQEWLSLEDSEVFDFCLEGDACNCCSQGDKDWRDLFMRQLRRRYHKGVHYSVYSTPATRTWLACREKIPEIIQDGNLLARLPSHSPEGLLWRRTGGESFDDDNPDIDAVPKQKKGGIGKQSDILVPGGDPSVTTTIEPISERRLVIQAEEYFNKCQLSQIIPETNVLPISSSDHSSPPQTVGDPFPVEWNPDDCKTKSSNVGDIESICSTVASNIEDITEDSWSNPEDYYSGRPILNGHQRQIAEKSMGEFWDVMNRYWKIIVAQRTRGHEQSTSTSAGSSSYSCPELYSSVTEQPEKQQQKTMKRDRKDGDDDDDEDEKSFKRPKDNMNDLENPIKKPRYACPYRKHNRRRYNLHDHRTCALSWFETIARLKEHLYRTHRAAIRCPRCLIELEDRMSLDTHLRAEPVCQAVEGEPIEGFDLDVEEKIRRKKKDFPNQTDADKWHFEPPRDDPPPPEILIEDYIRQEIPRRVRVQIENQLAKSDNLASTHKQLTASMMMILEAAIDSCISAYKVHLEEQKSQARLMTSSKAFTRPSPISAQETCPTSYRRDMPTPSVSEKAVTPTMLNTPQTASDQKIQPAHPNTDSVTSEVDSSWLANSYQLLSLPTPDTPADATNMALSTGPDLNSTDLHLSTQSPENAFYPPLICSHSQGLSNSIIESDITLAAGDSVVLEAAEEQFLECIGRQNQRRDPEFQTWDDDGSANEPPGFDMDVDIDGISDLCSEMGLWN